MTSKNTHYLTNFYFSFLLFFLFGAKSYGQCFQNISSKYDKVVAINFDSTLWTWSGVRFSREYGVPVKIDSSKNWKEISTGKGFAIAIKSDGTLWSWGENGSGQLGDGTTSYKTTLTKMTSDSNWLNISCGSEFVIGIKNNGTIWAWGRNNYGQLGQGLNRISSSVPIQIGTDTNFINVEAGKYFSLVMKSINSLWHVGGCVTSGINSQLNQVSNTNDWSYMSGGSYDNYAIKQNGTLWKFVNNNGVPGTISQIGTSTDWKQVDNPHVTSQDQYVLLIKTNGTLWAFGDNRLGQLGIDSIIYSLLPSQVGSDTDWKNAIAGEHTGFGLKNDYSFWAWGRNEEAQFGNGEHKNKILPVDSLFTWRTVEINGGASYGPHCLAIG